MSARPRAVIDLLIGILLLLACPLSHGQEFPDRPMRMIVPTSPGGLGDVVPRIMAAEMSRLLGQPIVVENKPGANQMIGYEYVARRVPADGYTIAAVNVQALSREVTR